MTIHEFLQLKWKPPNDLDKIVGLVQAPNKVIIVTELFIYGCWAANDGKPVIYRLTPY
jgi:hypothetical protein